MSDVPLGRVKIVILGNEEKNDLDNTSFDKTKKKCGLQPAAKHEYYKPNKILSHVYHCICVNSRDWVKESDRSRL